MDGMMKKGGMEPADLSERPQEAGGDKSAGGPPPQRFSAKWKLRAVSRLLRASRWSWWHGSSTSRRRGCRNGASGHCWPPRRR
jgi:hypothetical protein